MTATYSPEDNKLRLYAVDRLPKELYDRVRANGFIWAPRQKLFVAPMWTPARENLLIELCGEIGDEDTTLVDRAEERAERFEDYSDSRTQDAERAHKAVESIAGQIPLGQPILVGHHSERRARKDAERIQNGMRKAVKMWETAKYWEQRAQGAIHHAKYKELPAVRHRRIKGIEADKRKAEKEIAEAIRFIKAWRAKPITWERAKAITNSGSCYLSRCYPLADFPRDPPASQYEGQQSLWSALGDKPGEGIVSPKWARLDACRAYVRSIRHYRRWIKHYDNRLAYERAMLGESGGIVASKFDLKVGGQVLNRSGEWSTILKVNKAHGAVSSVSTNNRSYPRVIPIERISDYRPPTEEQATNAKKATALPPLCNYPGEGFTVITQAEWDKKYKDWKSSRIVEATASYKAHRVRSGFFGETTGSYRHNSVLVFISDAKTKLPPVTDTIAPLKPVELPPITKDLPTLERQTAQIVAAREKREAEAEAGNKFDALKDALKAGVKTVSAPQLFPTPAAIAAQVVALAKIENSHRILEPSAGTGNLVAALVKRDSCARVQAVEISPALTEQLRGRFGLGNYNVEIACRDFLETNGELGTFDRIVMNPPFANGADIKHIEHARTKLKPGGRLVAICANGPRQQERLKPAATEWHDLPAGSFADQGTNVNTAIVVFDAEDAEPTPAGLLF